MQKLKRCARKIDWLVSFRFGSGFFPRDVIVPASPDANEDEVLRQAVDTIVARFRQKLLRERWTPRFARGPATTRTRPEVRRIKR